MNVPMKIEPVNFDGVNIYPFTDLESCADFCVASKGIAVSVNAEAILSKDDDFRKIINENIGYADGVGAVWALRKKGIRQAKKIPGVELWLAVLRKLPGCKVYLVGATDEVITKTVARLTGEIPSIEAAGFRNGYFSSPEEMGKLRDNIGRLKPDVVVIAMGQPAQEKLAKSLQEIHPALYLCVGGSFDVFSGIKRRAPKVFVKLQLEWLYRLLQDPRRWRRYVNLFRFLLKLI